MDTNIVEISLEQLDQLFQENPETIPTADSLSVGKEESSENPQPPVQQNIPGHQGILEAPEDLFEEAEVEGSETTSTVETTENTNSATEQQASTESSNTDSVNEILTNTVDFLVKEGFWADFDGIEELGEVTPEIWAELSAKQAQIAATAMFDELLDETGDYGKAIITHIKRGGDPNEIIDIFKEQKNISSIDTSTEEGKSLKIESYYKDILGWKQDRIKRHINRLIENDEVDEEFETIDEAYQKHYSDKLQEAQERQQVAERDRIDKQKAFVNSIKGVLDESGNLTNKEKQIIASSILDFKHKLPNGQKVNDFYLKFAEVQTNPKEYVELVQFIMNKDAYLKRVQKQEETKANKKAFEFIKGNKAVSSSKGQNISITKPKPERTGTDFSFFTKK